jgi:hypothetical protein
MFTAASEVAIGKSLTVSYDPAATGVSGRASFWYRFEHETELAGSMALKLWIETTEGEDLDVFVLIRKLDPGVELLRV